MNCIFITVFNQSKYVDMLYLLLESMFIYGNIDEDTDILVYTSTAFMDMIKKSHLYHSKIKFEVNDTYNSIDTACKARLDVFNLPSITQYNKILYLDTDILVKDEINKVFNVCKEDILYVLEEGNLATETEDYHGKALFTNELDEYEDKTAFTSGILLFKNCETMQTLFQNIKEDMIRRPGNFSCYDQPYVVYNAFKYKVFNNKLLKSLVVNSDHNIYSNKVIHHFCGGPGVYQNKIQKMTIFLKSIKDFTINNHIGRTKLFINEQLMPIIYNCGEPLEGNIFMLHHTTQYTDMFINKAKNISNLVLNKNIQNAMEIGFNAGFSALLMLFSNPKLQLTCYDLGEHTYILPCFEKIKETFGDRIKIVIGDSTKTLTKVNDMYDLIHIDGGHLSEVANSDVINSYRMCKNGTILIMDDYNFPNLHTLWDGYIAKYKLKNLDIHIYPSPHHDIKYKSSD